MYSESQQEVFSLRANTIRSTERGFRMTSETHVLQLPMESTAGQESRFTSLHYFLLSHYIVIKRPFFFSFLHSNKQVFHKQAQLVRPCSPIILVFSKLQTARFSYASQSEWSMVFRECLAPYYFSLVNTGDLCKLLLR